MPTITTTGPVLAGTMRNMVAGLRGSPLPDAAAAMVVEQAAKFVQKLVDAYDADVSPGEVGAEGSGEASDTEPIHRNPTALLYGRVQSGKTAAMIATTALALDNGFRVVIVVTANNVALVRQTASRFKALSGPAVMSSAVDAEYEWEDQEEDIRDALPDEGLVIVCAKDVTHLPEVKRLLATIDAYKVPALILDDEADTATPDTTLSARSRGRANAPAFSSTTHRQVIENDAPGQAGESLREALPHHVYVQVTATPFVLFLQSPGAPLRPDIVHLLEPGAGYCGGEAFFAGYDSSATSPERPLVMVAQQESARLLTRREAPIGLAESIAYFLLAAAARTRASGGSFPAGGFKHLSHTSRLTTQHDEVASRVTRHVRTIRRALRAGDTNRITALFQSAYAELARSGAELEQFGAPLPSLQDLLLTVVEQLPQTEVLKVNANTGEPTYGPTLNFLIGGNILGRGITVDSLLVTYYLREAQTSQMDTVWQHGRMFGYRQSLMPYTRVYLPPRLAIVFKGIHESETDLREVLQELEPGQPVPISVVSGTRATRTNVLEDAAIRVYRPGAQIFPQHLARDVSPEALSNITALLQSAGVPIDEPDRERRFTEVSFDAMIDIARAVPVDPAGNGRWDTEAVIAVLEALRITYGDLGMAYVRAFEGSGRDYRRTGALSGPETTMARSFNRPTLALIYEPDQAGEPLAWLPTLVLPDGMPTQVFNGT